MLTKSRCPNEMKTNVIISVLSLLIVALAYCMWKKNHEELFQMKEARVTKEMKPYYPSAFNSVLGHEESESIVGCFRIDTIDKLMVVPRFMIEYSEKEPFEEFFLDGKKISEEYYREEGQYLWRVVSNSETLPPLDIYGYHPYLVFEGDLDCNGTHEFGILDTWLTSGWRMYSVYTFYAGQWVYLVEPFWTFITLRASGKELVRPSPASGTISITYSGMEAGSSLAGTDTVVIAGYYRIL